MTGKTFGTGTMHSKRGSGLRNRFRSGKSTYCVKHKGRRADRYGSFTNGKQQGVDTIAGHPMWSVREDKA